MGAYVDLLRSLPRTRRDVNARAADKNPEVVAVAKQYGRSYFDGDRKYGYGGYHYDGRWGPVASEILRNYFRVGRDGTLIEPARVLDVGCAKGFLVHDLCKRGADAFGLDISYYAVTCPEARGMAGRLHYGTAYKLPFPDQSFDLVLSINTLHNLPRARLLVALGEMRRVARRGMFVQVDSYRTPEEKALFEGWVLTAETHGTPEFWLELFEEAGYDGDYAWTIVEAG